MDAQGQSITLNIAGTEYPLKAKSPEHEQLMRLAAEDINDVMSKYDQKYPEKQSIDKLAFVTLNETMSRISAQRKLRSASDALASLNSEMEDYLSGIGKD